MRLHLIALLCAFTALAAPSLAQSPDQRASLTRNALNCENWYTAHQYTASLGACTAAVAGFQQAAGVQQNNPWYAYYMKATMLSYQAFDESMLGHHRASLRSAIESHHLASYVYTTYKIDADDYRSINALVKQLVSLEAREQAYIRRGIGD